MNKGVKFRIYPNKEQQNLINQTLGCCRLIYNMGLDIVKNLAIRKWKCPNCHTKHDRDANASINILNKGLSIA